MDGNRRPVSPITPDPQDDLFGAESLVAQINDIDTDASAKRIFKLIEKLYPLCRSITGDGLRESLQILCESCPLQISELASGTRVFDWEIPREWNIRDAYVKNMAGEHVIDFAKNNLHVVNYSSPISRRMSLEELRPHLHTLPEKPDWIPYRTSYYAADWGFCLSHNDYLALGEGDYDVHIDATLEPGSLTYGERILDGSSEDKVLLFAHTCHPSLANDNLSGMAMLAELANILAPMSRKYTYHFVFAPATIGSISWLSQNESDLAKINHGLVASVVGDAGDMHYKKTRSECADIDRAAAHVLEHSGEPYQILDFSPWGYDERQFCSPGIGLPIGRLTRTPNGMYPEYHTSADDLTLVRPEYLAKSLQTYLHILCCLETDRVYRNLQPKGEPQLGRRGLYRKMGGFQDIAETQLAMLWMLNMSDGTHSVLDIAIRSGISYLKLHSAATALRENNLLELIKD